MLQQGVKASTFNLFSTAFYPLPSASPEREFFISAVSYWHRPRISIQGRSPSTPPREPDEPCLY